MCSRFDSPIGSDMPVCTGPQYATRKGPFIMADPISSATIDAWEDDPIAAIQESQPPMNTPVPHARPDLDVPRLPVAVDGGAPAVEAFKVGAPGFRYWALADAMARGAAFWSACLPEGLTWQADNGPRLIAFPD